MCNKWTRKTSDTLIQHLVRRTQRVFFLLKKNCNNISYTRFTIERYVFLFSREKNFFYLLNKWSGLSQLNSWLFNIPHRLIIRNNSLYRTYKIIINFDWYAIRGVYLENVQWLEELNEKIKKKLKQIHIPTQRDKSGYVFISQKRFWLILKADFFFVK